MIYKYVESSSFPITTIRLNNILCGLFLDYRASFVAEKEGSSPPFPQYLSLSLSDQFQRDARNMTAIVVAVNKPTTTYHPSKN